MRRQGQRAASIGEATPGASHGRLRIRPTLLQKKGRRPAKAASRRSGEIQASPQPTTDCLMPQRVVTKDESGHRFDYRHGSRKNTRIMSSVRGELTLLFGTRDSFLLKRNRRGRFECHAKINVFAIANSALDASGLICLCPYFSSAHLKWIVVLGAAHPRCSKTGSPRPGGIPRITHSMRPPIESPWSRTCSMSDIILFAAAASAQRTMFFSTSFIFAVERSIFAVMS